MTREDAIYRLNNTAWLGSDADRVAIGNAVQMAIEALKEQQWIPCSEVLPSENGDYLVTYRWIGTYSCEAYLEIGIDEWRKGEWVEKPTAWEVLAWMPLPEPMRLENES